MTTTVRAIYDEGVLRLRRLLPLPPQSEVLVTLDLPSVSAEGGSAAAPVTWPDIAARLRTLYGASAFPENPVLAARNDERY